MKKSTFLAAMVLSLALPAAASAQHTNSGPITYEATSGVTINGLYTNTATGQVTALGNSNSPPATALTVGGFLNHGLVTITSAVSLSTGILVTSGNNFTNTGTVNITTTIILSHGINIENGSFNNTGSVTTNTQNGSSGISVNNGNFNNQGGVVTTTAFSNNSYGINVTTMGFSFNNQGGQVQAIATDSGTGIIVNNDGFNNQGGKVQATATNRGTGINVSNGRFNNQGGQVQATATGVSSSTGILARDFDNLRGTVTATAVGVNNYGINLSNGNFDNTGGTARLFGGQSAIRLAASGNQFIADGASTFVVGSGGGITFNNNGILDFSAGSPKLMLLETAAQSGSATYTVARSGGALTSNGQFSLPSGPVFSYSQNNTGTEYQVTATRQAYASDLVGGAGSDYVGALESYLADGYFGNWNGYFGADDPRLPWAGLMWDVNHSATLAELKAKANRMARLESAQATGQALVLTADANRQIGRTFTRELTKSWWSPAARPSYGDGGAGTASLWASPMYFQAKQKASDAALSTVDADWYGVSFGGCYAPTDRFTWGLGLHFLHGEFDGGREYDADSDAWGAGLGFAARPQWGSFKPMFTAAYSATFHSFDQTRRDIDGGRYNSSPDVTVTTLALAMTHDFNLAGDGSLTLRPKLGVDWTRTSIDDYHESGSHGTRPLSVSGDNYNSLRSGLGAALLWSPTETVDLEFRAGWLHEWQDRYPLLSNTALSTGWNLATPTADSSREAAALGISAGWSPNESLTLSLDYDAVLGDDLRSHSIAGTFRWDF